MMMESAASAGLEVTPLHPSIGAAVRGVDLRRALEPATVEALHALWMTHLVLVFPDQAISDREQVEFGRRFGRLEVHPSLAHRSSVNPEIYRVSNVDESGHIVPAADASWQYLRQSWRWHTDSSFREVPSTGSILHGIEVTNAGGHTLFANMYAAFESLSDACKARIVGLRVVHDHDYILRASEQRSLAQDRERYEKLVPVIHPLVRVHPVTARRSLFLSPHTMVGIEGMSSSEGRALLDELIAHSIADERVYRHVWSTHDVVMWDNRCTMHAVEPFDNVNVRRIMHRVTLAGEGAPIAAH